MKVPEDDPKVHVSKEEDPENWHVQVGIYTTYRLVIMGSLLIVESISCFLLLVISVVWFHFFIKSMSIFRFLDFSLD